MVINNTSMSMSHQFSPFPKTQSQKSFSLNCFPLLLVHPFTKRLENIFLLLQNSCTLGNIY